jgi:hypothetical protein
LIGGGDSEKIGEHKKGWYSEKIGEHKKGETLKK